MYQFILDKKTANWFEMLVTKITQTAKIDVFAYFKAPEMLFSAKFPKICGNFRKKFYRINLYVFIAKQSFRKQKS